MHHLIIIHHVSLSQTGFYPWVTELGDEGLYTYRLVELERLQICQMPVDCCVLHEHILKMDDSPDTKLENYTLGAPKWQRL